MTTIDNASISVWLTPAIIVRIASGSWISHSICQRVAPNDSPASTSSPSLACQSIRIPGAVASTGIESIPRQASSFSVS